MLKDSGPARVPAAPRVEITVGVHSEDGATAHATAFGETVADIGTIHEFGAPAAGIPERSFVRAWFDEAQPFIRDTLRKQFQLALKGRIDAATAGERCALAFEGAVKQRIARGIPPPNAPSTIARKGSSKPLIDTGQLRGAVRGRSKVG